MEMIHDWRRSLEKEIENQTEVLPLLRDIYTRLNETWGNWKEQGSPKIIAEKTTIEGMEQRDPDQVEIKENGTPTHVARRFLKNIQKSWPT
jgi:hypothetical protein